MSIENEMTDARAPVLNPDVSGRSAMWGQLYDTNLLLRLRFKATQF